MKAPFISVISIAYQRKEFINKAISSAIDQTLPREFYEIILVSDVEIDEQLVSKGNVKIIHSSERNVGAKVALALELCLGQVICLLEDDDIWERNKLETIFYAFRKTPSLGFYHNGWTVIDRDGRSASHPVHSTGRKILSRVGNVTASGKNLSYSGLRRLVGLNADFNGSSMAIRKSILTRHVEHLKRIRLNYDPFIFYSAVVSGYLITVDSQILTKYRVHRKNYSKNLGNQSAEPDYSDLYVIRDMLLLEPESQNSLKSLNCSISDIEIENHWVLGTKNRLGLLRALMNHIRYLTIWELEYDVLLIGFTVLCIVFPAIGRSIYMNAYSNAQ